MERRDTLLVGVVAYDPKVVTIWNGFKDYFDKRGVPIDTILYGTYERQVEAHLLGQLDVAWNSPLAWIQAQRLASLVGRQAQAIAMRDTDRDLTSVVVVRTGSTVQRPDDLRGKKVAVGAADSPQATLIPLLALAESGLEPDAGILVQRHDLLLGKHGDHVGGEREAALSLQVGAAEAACMIDFNHLLFTQEGTLLPGSTRVLIQTPPYDHCNFTILDEHAGPGGGEALGRFREILLGMSWEDPTVRRLMEMEGLRRWVPGRTDGYAQLNRAVDRFGVLEPWLSAMRQVLDRS
jgi:phosphonate transport system substrate-binding protein